LIQEGAALNTGSICTLKDLTEEIVERSPDHIAIGDVEAELLLYQILQEERDNLDTIPFEWGIGKLVNSLLPFIQSIIDFRVEYPDCLGGLQGERSADISRIHRRYLEEMERRGLLDSKMAKVKALELLRDDRVERENTFLFGFYEPTPLERELITEIVKRSSNAEYSSPFAPNGRIFLDGGEWIQAGEVKDHGPPAKLRPLLSVMDHQKVDAPRIKTAQFRDRLEEFRAVAQEIRELIRDGVSPSEIVVLLPVRRKISELASWVMEDMGIPYSIHSDSPLPESPVTAAFMDVLDAPSLDRETIVKVLRSPYMRFYFEWGEETKRLWGQEVDHLSREAGVIGGLEDWRASLEALKVGLEQEIDSPECPDWRANKYRRKIQSIDKVSHGLEELFYRLSTLQGRKPLSVKVRDLRALLNKLKFGEELRKRDDHLVSGESRTLKKIVDLLDLLETGPLAERRMELEEFASIVRMAASSFKLPEDRNENAVQITGLRANVLLEYRYAFITGMVDGEIPYTGVEYAFANEEEKRRMGVLQREDLLRHERYYFLMSLLSGKNGVYLSAPLSEGDKRLVTSPFFDLFHSLGLETFGEEPLHSTMFSQGRLGESIAGKTDLPPYLAPSPIAPGEAARRINVEQCHRRGEYDSHFDAVLADPDVLKEVEEAHGPSKVYSATPLETYAECPFWYYMRHVLRLEPFPELEREITPLEKGTLFHNIAHRFYSTRKGRISMDELDPEKDRIKEIAREEMDRFSYTGPSWKAFRTKMFGNDRMKGLLDAFLDHEVEHPLTGLEPTYFELSLGIEGASPPGSEDPISLPLGEEEINFRCKVDRVDIGSKGEVFILDYKTGRYAPRLKEMWQGKRLQLPLYLLATTRAIGGKPIGASYYMVNDPNDIEYGSPVGDAFHAMLMGTLSGKQGVNSNFKDLLEIAKGSALECIRGMRKGLFHPRKEEKCPFYCDYPTVCRFDDLRLLEMEGDDAD
ncbi:MAG: PD-(D/E)XK nuclease family protein, partial [Methanomassiliicoccales archaeon]